MSSLSKQLNREMYIFSSLHPMKETNSSLIYKQCLPPPPVYTAVTTLKHNRSHHQSFKSFPENEVFPN